MAADHHGSGRTDKARKTETHPQTRQEGSACRSPEFSYVCTTLHSGPSEMWAHEKGSANKDHHSCWFLLFAHPAA
jgi:hypothetical protein